MKFRNLLLSLSVVATLGLAGCATTYSGDPYYSSSSARQYDRRDVGAQMVSYGTIETVRAVSLQRQSGPGAGAVVGAIIGGVVGNQVQKSRNYEYGLEIVVRLDNGGRVAVVQNQDYNFRSGDRVKVVGSGDRARVAPL